MIHATVTNGNAFVARIRHRALAALLLAGTVAIPAYSGELSHAADLDDLRERMRRMATLVYENTLTPLEIDRERARRAGEIAELAADLAAATANLVRNRPDVIADAARRERFTAHSDALAAAAGELDLLVGQRRMDAIPAQLERVAHACAACHADFR